jgi:hypothetical protein
MPVDRRALGILKSTFWTSSGWRPKRQFPAPEDFEYARKAGLMFEPVELDHDAGGSPPPSLSSQNVARASCRSFRFEPVFWQVGPEVGFDQLRCWPSLAASHIQSEPACQLFNLQHLWSSHIHSRAGRLESLQL